MSQQTRNFIIAAILVLIALGAGIKGYVHNQFKTDIDNTLQKLQLFALVRYSELSTSVLSGEVTLENIRISSQYLPDEIKIKQVTLETPGFGYMLKGPDNLQAGKIPEHLGIVIDGFTIDLNSKLAEWFDSIVIPLNRVYAQQRKICGGKSLFGPTEYKAMGYASLSSNMRIAFDFDEGEQELTMKMRADTVNFGKGNMTLTISGINPANMQAMQSLPHLDSMKATYTDSSYIPRMLHYCAEQSKMEKEAYIKAEAEQSDEYFFLAWGFAPGPGLREAYRDYLTQPGDIEISMQPQKEFNPILAQSMDAQQVIDMLNLKVKVNNTDIKDLSIRIPDPQTMAKYEAELKNSLDLKDVFSGEVVAPSKVTPEPERYIVERAYKTVPIGTINQYVGEQVRVITKTGQEREGTLEKIAGKVLYIQRKVYSGKFTMQVKSDQVKKVEVYLSQRRKLE